MRFVSLFSGCGGLDQGLERAAHECVCQVENDKRPLAILRKQWPNVPKITDVRLATNRNLPRFDMLVGGFPCTNLSVAGKREGLAGDASGLWFEMQRITSECSPAVVLIENVPGLFSLSDGEDFSIVLAGLLGVPIGIPRGGWKTAGIAKGRIYHVAWRVLDSQFFGVAQQRRRVFIAGCLATCGINPAEILFDREGVRRDYSSSHRAKEAVAKAPCGSPDESGWRGGQVSSSLTHKFNGAEQAGRLVVGSLTSGGGGVDDNDAQAGRIIAGSLKSEGMRGYNTDTFPYVSAEKAPTLNASFATKQGLENQHIDGGGGCSSRKSAHLKQPAKRLRNGNHDYSKTP